MRIAVDVMGGDNAPDQILKGCIQAIPLLSHDDRLLLVGDDPDLDLAAGRRAGWHVRNA